MIAELDLRESAGLDMVEQLRTISDRPIIILTQEAATDCVIEAMRLGVCDVLVHPFAIAQLLDRAQHVLREHELAGKRAVKYRSMRQLVRRALRERRELNQRVELVCKDLVDSHRRLVHRVINTDVVTSHPSE